MIKNNSKTRLDYRRAYQRLRLYGGWLDGFPSFRLMDETSECALTSWDNHDSEFSGWINRQRMHQFYTRKFSSLPPAWMPF